MKKKLLLILCSILLISGCKDVKLENGENAVVKFKEGGISSNQLYEVLKSTYGAEKVIDLMDMELLKRDYKDTTEENNYVRQNIKALKDAAKKSNIDFELYLNYYYGVADEVAFRDYLSLNYKRDLWKNDYAKETVTDKQINEYYETKVYGDIDASQILITVDAKKDATEEEKKEAENKALEKAKNIIKKLNDGEDFAALAKENSKDAETAKNGGAMGKINDGDAATEVLNALVSMKDGSYSTTPVKSSYGYHILYRTSQDKKPKLEDVKEKVINKIASEIAMEPTFNSVALKALREKNEMKFEDKDLEKDYDKLMARYEAQLGAAK